MFEGEFWDKVESGADYQSVEAELLKLTRPLGVTAVSSIEVRAPVTAKPFLGRLFGKRDTEYVARYRRENLGQHDVAAQRVLRSERAFSWEEVRPNIVTAEQEAVFGAAAEHGYKDGWVVPYYAANGGLGITTFMGEHICDDPVSKRLLSFSGHSFYGYAQRKSQPEEAFPAGLKLSHRQKEALYWIARGKTDWEIGTLLGISPRTVNRHVEDLKTKLNARSRAEALSYAIALNLVDRI